MMIKEHSMEDAGGKTSNMYTDHSPGEMYEKTIEDHNS